MPMERREWSRRELEEQTNSEKKGQMNPLLRVRYARAVDIRRSVSTVKALST